MAAGEELMDYRGEVITWDEALDRYASSDADAGHTFFFDLGDGRVIDGGVGGNAARFINHGCAPNVEATVEGSRVTFSALRDIAAGQELLLDYRLELHESAEDEEREWYGCRCIAADCRGTMLAG
jgi:SET domain-containing protein